MRAPKRFYRDRTPEVARFVRWLYFIARLKQQQIALIVGCSQGNISKIVSEQIWIR